MEEFTLVLSSLRRHLHSLEQLKYVEMLLDALSTLFHLPMLFELITYPLTNKRVLNFTHLTNYHIRCINDSLSVV